MPAKKEAPPVEEIQETPVYTRPYCSHIAAKAVLCLVALFVGFSILVAAFGTGFAAGRFTSHGKDGRYGMMGRGGYGRYYGREGYGRGMMNRDGYEFGKNGLGQGRGQCPAFPDNLSNGDDSEELPPNNAPVTP